MTNVESIPAKYANNLKEARKLLGEQLPDSEIILIAGRVRRKPPALAGCLNMQGFYDRYLVLTRERLFLLKGFVKLGKIELEKPVSSLKSMRFQKSILVVQADGDEIALQFLKFFGGANFASDLVVCLMSLGIPMEADEKKK